MRHILPLLLLLACGPTVSAQEARAAVPGSKSATEKLVEQLGDPHFQTREAAGQKLLDLGERALAALEAGLSSDVPEVARRCEDLIPAVKRRIDADLILTPTLVDLPNDELPVQKVFDHLLNQTRYQLRVDGDQSVLSSRVKLSGGRMPFWEAVHTVCSATKLDVHNVAAQSQASDRDRPPLGAISLRAADGVKRVSVHKALLIQVSPPTKDELAQHLPTHSPLIVRVCPEPKVKWHRFLAAEVVKATDKAGQPINPATSSSGAFFDQTYDFRLSERPLRSVSNASGNAATRGALYLAPGPTEVGSLTATARFTAWKESGELAAVKLTDGLNSGTTYGPYSTRLTATVVGPISNDPGSTTVEVKVRWDANRLRVERSAGEEGAVWFENVNGRLVPVTATASPDRKGPATSAHGIAIANAAGEPLTLSGGNVRIDTSTENGQTFSEVSVTYVTKGNKLTDSKPAVVSFHGARIAEVVAPFRAKDLPLTVGLRDPDEHVRIKR